MASDDHPGLASGALVGGRVSVGSVRRRKVRRTWLSPGSVITLGVIRRDGAEVHGLYLGRWRNGSKRPVLKHGPRSLTSMRVFGCKARARNESERRRQPLEGAPPTGPGVLRRI